MASQKLLTTCLLEHSGLETEPRIADTGAPSWRESSGQNKGGATQTRVLTRTDLGAPNAARTTAVTAPLMAALVRLVNGHAHNRVPHHRTADDGRLGCVGLRRHWMRIDNWNVATASGRAAPKHRDLHGRATNVLGLHGVCVEAARLHKHAMFHRGRRPAPTAERHAWPNEEAEEKVPRHALPIVHHRRPATTQQASALRCNDHMAVTDRFQQVLPLELGGADSQERAHDEDDGHGPEEERQMHGIVVVLEGVIDNVHLACGAEDILAAELP
eukprot:CAMPEP_0176212782 /NCGR_PEP_ID=MMETSP0121_2-20121125/15326_1 /TAXON_ID=160619 /ORGANISM="Kryptoperidinium foliaceum, Strain CCMP 1326" /LENGTH=271 /DNA_ID=CAMNT_0017551835 /DNA_START=254 /DNA_END=1066 /DNA_ORIENTATION=-